MTADAAAAVSTYSWILPAFTGVIAGAIGGYFANVSARKWQILADERLRCYQELIENIDAARECALEYYSLDKRPAMPDAQAVKLLTTVTNVAAQFNNIEMWLKPFPNEALKEHDKFREVCTGSEFQKDKTDDKHVLKISNQSRKFRDSIWVCYFQELK